MTTPPLHMPPIPGRLEARLLAEGAPQATAASHVLPNGAPRLAMSPPFPFAPTIGALAPPRRTSSASNAEFDAILEAALDEDESLWPNYGELLRRMTSERDDLHAEVSLLKRLVVDLQAEVVNKEREVSRMHRLLLESMWQANGYIAGLASQLGAAGAAEGRGVQRVATPRPPRQDVTPAARAA